MKKVAIAALLLLTFGLPFLGRAEAATSTKAHGGKKRHTHARHHSRKSTAGPQKSHSGKQSRHSPRARTHARTHKAAPPASAQR